MQSSLMKRERLEETDKHLENSNSISGIENSDSTNDEKKAKLNNLDQQGDEETNSNIFSIGEKRRVTVDIFKGG